jgi:hypothetical protein
MSSNKKITISKPKFLCKFLRELHHHASMLTAIDKSLGIYSVNFHSHQDVNKKFKKVTFIVPILNNDKDE